MPKVLTLHDYSKIKLVYEFLALVTLNMKIYNLDKISGLIDHKNVRTKTCCTISILIQIYVPNKGHLKRFRKNNGRGRRPSLLFETVSNVLYLV